MRNFWLPNRKGTELFPQVMQAPTKLVVQGVDPSSPLYAAVIGQFSGRLKAFHARQQQVYALSTNTVHRAHMQWDDGRATYTNIQGQEVLKLEVHHSAIEESEQQQQQQKTHWDWVLIEIEIPNTNNSNGVIGAQMFAARQAPKPKEVGLAFAGLAYDAGNTDSDGNVIWSDGLNPFVISYAPQDNPARTASIAAGTTQRSSLLVDLRRFPGVPVAIDIHGSLNMGGTFSTSTVIDGYQRYNETTASTTLGPWLVGDPWPYSLGRYRYNLYGVATDNVYDPSETPYTALYVGGSGAGLTVSPIPVPAPFLSTTGITLLNPEWEDSLIFHPISNLLIGITDYTPNAGHIIQQVTTWDIQELSHDVSTFIPAPDETRVADVRGIGGFGHPADWGQTLFTGADLTFAEWDRLSQPGHLTTQHVNNVAISPTTDFLGRVSIDPLLKSISFKPA